VDVEIQVCFEQSPDEQNIFYFNNYFCESTALPPPQHRQINKSSCAAAVTFISKCENVKMP
jgi:hypothetical protein